MEKLNLKDKSLLSTIIDFIVQTVGTLGYAGIFIMMF